ncbi:hypothetical protein [Mucilaginibacter polytrichastri]|uniref:Uncharacterized protein n=1 Tax=Mucilaginibacter polytrichastri TaxID=1302689 RepID=A0A1Q6A0J4_9SPHI|nr:hypothetical protein [Mucilaginibacter polytrichastri]OKS87539.1 hypothetical protein RG47T_3000 [Mucilaginibacter polytrichastri]SFS91871.1 hypothetical protein SAMN04487890_106131 [Mucilaginibacter polytrichastri]
MNNDQINQDNSTSNYFEKASAKPDLKKWSFSSTETTNLSNQETKQNTPSEHLFAGLRQAGSDKYRCEAVSLFKIDHVVVSKSSTMTDFTIAIIEKDNRYSVAEISVQNTYLDNSIEQFASYNAMLKNIASVKDKIILKIDNSGLIINVLNKDELKEKWLQVKADLQRDRMFNTFKPEEQKLILQGGDDEYLKDFDMVSFINKGHTLYPMFFCGYWKEYQIQETYDLKPQLKNSTIFKDEVIPLEVYGKVKRYTNNNNNYQLEIQAIESRSFDTGKLKKLYKENYPFAKVEFDDYSYDYSTKIEADVDTGWIKTLGMTVLEQAGSIVMFMDCTIKQLSDEKSNITE